MGQKVHPLGFRLGIFEDWSVKWFSRLSYNKEVAEDLGIRKYLKTRLSDTDIAKLVIEKAGQSVRVIVHSAKPGALIGKRGQGITQLRDDLLKKFGKNVEISVKEVKVPEIDAAVVAKGITSQIERRVNFKRLMKRAGFAAMKSGAKGIKICCGGRLGGAEIARKEWLRLGSVPLHTLRSNVDYAAVEAKTIYGIVGVKVWICKGTYSETKKD
ncbi:30S ribosomal protein S3 [bacterium]|nr:30S ribosomal protein S3 [bacterium]